MQWYPTYTNIFNGSATDPYEKKKNISRGRRMTFITKGLFFISSSLPQKEWRMFNVKHLKCTIIHVDSDIAMLLSWSWHLSFSFYFFNHISDNWGDEGHRQWDINKEIQFSGGWRRMCSDDKTRIWVVYILGMIIGPRSTYCVNRIIHFNAVLTEHRNLALTLTLNLS